MHRTKCSHYLKAFNVQKSLMKLTGIWPHKNNGNIYKMYGFLISIAVQTTCMMPSLALVISKSVDVAEGCYILFCIITTFTYFIKVFVLYAKRPLFYEILNNLEQPLFEHHDVHTKNAILYSNRTRKLIQFPCIFFIVFIAAFPFLDKGDTTRPLPFPMPLNVQEMNVFSYGALYFLQILAAAVCALNNGNLDTLACSFIALATAQLEILAEKLEIADGDQAMKMESREEQEVRVLERVKNCAKHHAAVCEYIGNLENMFMYTFLAQSLTSVIAICIAGFSFLLIPVANMMFYVSASYFIAAMVEISMYCLFGDELIIQSVKIRDACYSSEWNNYGPEVRKMLFIIMERSKKPLVLTAGKFMQLSRISLVAICKSSFSYFAVLRKVYENEE